MSVAALQPQDPISRLESEPSVILQAEALSENFAAPVKPHPNIETINIAPDGPLLESIPSQNGTNGVNSHDEPKAALKAINDTWLQLNHVTASVQEPATGAKKLRKMLLETNELIICPGVYDGLSARTAIELGFNAMYMVSNIIYLAPTCNNRRTYDINYTV